MTNRLNLLLLPAAFLFTTGAVFFPTQDQPAEAVYKNIKTFKGTPAKDIIPSMQFICASLKVDCNYCHVQGDFAADTKEEKGTARKMIEMQRQINKDFFEGHLEITCNSCHNGRTHPNSLPNLAGLTLRHKRFETTVKPADLVQKYTTAAGADLKPITLEGSGKMGENKMPVTLTVSGDKFVMTMGEMKVGFDGETAWHAAGGHVTKLTGTDTLPIRRMGRIRVPAAEFAGLERQSVSGKEMLGADSCLVVRGTNSTSKVTEEFYFDEATGLLRRIATITPSSLGRFASYVDFSDYRDVAGTKVPFKINSTNGEGEVTDVTFESGKEATVDASAFSAPAG